MESIISLRAFDTDEPTHTHTWGLLGDAEPDGWAYTHDPIPGPDRVRAAFRQYREDQLTAIDTEQPAPQAVYDGVVVVLDELLFRVTDDSIECEYRLVTGADLADGQTICSGRYDAERGGSAERTHDGLRIADAVQRTADALGHRIEWLVVIAPESFAHIAEAAEELVDTEAGDE